MGLRGEFTAITGVTALVLSIAAGGIVAETAQGGACRYADGEASEIGRKHARDAVVCLINNRRDVRGKRRLDAHRGLHRAAGRHSRRMERSDCFSHRCPGERDLADRISSTSYLPCNCSWGIGENIGWGSGGRGTPREIVKRWMDSAGHRDNILDGDFRHLGVGVAADGNAAIYTADFGYRR